MEMEEYMILTRFQQEVQKSRDKDWHDRHIKRKSFKEGNLVLVYESKFLQHLGKFKMHWLGPYEVKTVTDGEFVHLKYLGRTELRGMINGNRLKMYRDSRLPST
jgi:hypothetical protein